MERQLGLHYSRISYDEGVPYGEGVALATKRYARRGERPSYRRFLGHFTELLRSVEQNTVLDSEARRQGDSDLVSV